MRTSITLLSDPSTEADPPARADLAGFTRFRLPLNTRPSRMPVLSPIFLLILSLVFQCTALADYSSPGPFPVSQRTIPVKGVNNASFTAEVFYPGTKDAYHSTVGKTPVYSHAHGYSGWSLLIPPKRFPLARTRFLVLTSFDPTSR